MTEIRLSIESPANIAQLEQWLEMARVLGFPPESPFKADLVTRTLLSVTNNIHNLEPTCATCVGVDDYESQV